MAEKKNRILIILIIELMLVAGVALSLSFQLKQKGKELQAEKKIVALQSAQLTPKPTPTIVTEYYSGEPSYSPNGFFSINLSVKGMYKDRIKELSVGPVLSEFKVEAGKEEWWNGNLLNFKPSTSGILAWSHDGLKTVAFLPDQIIIYYFSLEGKTLVKKSQEAIPGFTYNETDKFRGIFFSEDDKELYIINGGKKYRYLFDKKDLILLSGIQMLERYPISNSTGYISWKEQRSDKGERGFWLVSDNLTPAINSKIPISSDTDYIYNILISPDHSKACVRYGSSGSYNYNVFNLYTGNIYDTGGYLADCTGWLDANRIIVEVSDNSRLYFEVNTATGEKNFLHSIDFYRE